MKQINIFIITAILLVYSQASLSAEWFYIGGTYGQTTYDTGITNPTGTAKIEDEADTSKVLLGFTIGFWDLTAEIYDADLGGTTFTANSGDTYMYNESPVTVLVNGYKRVSENSASGVNLLYRVGFDIGTVYAKAGVMYWSTTVTTSINGVTTEVVTQKGADALVGMGFDYHLAPFTLLRLDYERSELDEMPLSTISLGVVFAY